MGAVLGILSNPLFLKIGLSLLDGFLKKKGADAEKHKALATIADFLRKNGVDAAKTSFEAEDQITLGSDEWDRREQAAKDPQGGE